jgi:hypothetical protein
LKRSFQELSYKDLVEYKTTPKTVKQDTMAVTGYAQKDPDLGGSNRI